MIKEITLQDILESIIVEIGMTGEYSEGRENRLNKLYDKVKGLEVQDDK